MKIKLINLLDTIYSNPGYSYGIDYFSQFLDELKKYDFAEILAAQTKFDVDYILSFILSTPNLWSNLSGQEWIRIMSVLNPRPAPFTREIYNSGYVDVHFLCKYLRVNSIKIFIQQKEFSNEDKKKLLQYSQKVADLLFADELDWEDLDGEYFVDRNIIETLRLKLIARDLFEPLIYNNGNQLKEYIQKELDNLENID
jgi:hypothetical protein